MNVWMEPESGQESEPWEKKTLHAVLKQYFEPRKENQEVPVGPYVADICNEQGIFEIQTRDLTGFGKNLLSFWSWDLSR